MADCNKCRHYYITWDTDFPAGCRALRFKSREAPSAAVRRSSGMECQLFEPRAKGRGGRPAGGGRGGSPAG